jgi:hypothetical protein
MNKRAIVLLTAIGSALALPALGSHRAANSAAQEARYELRQLDSDINKIPNPHMRSHMASRVDRLESLVEEMQRDLDRAKARPASRPLLFEDVMFRVQNERFDSGRLEIIRRAGGRAALTTRQARQLASTCSFESCRTEALIALYPAVIDNYRFGRALDILVYASSRREVERALGL